MQVTLFRRDEDREITGLLIAAISGVEKVEQRNISLFRKGEGSRFPVVAFDASHSRAVAIIEDFLPLGRELLAVSRVSPDRIPPDVRAAIESHSIPVLDIGTPPVDPESVDIGIRTESENGTRDDDPLGDLVSPPPQGEGVDDLGRADSLPEEGDGKRKQKKG